ncbi:PIN domain-containing protein [Rhodobacterales bacterium HKCCE2091]|nr:PIN domain-containing protein [Rhodobacterales bacterium HKCCE2091]
MIACLDACVLFPTVLREILAGCARAGLYRPVWSERIVEEWVRAAAKLGPGQAEVARGEAAVLRAEFPHAGVEPGEAADLWLPDPADIHVLAAARAGGAEAIVTLNLKDFPRRELSPLGISAVHPDAFLLALWQAEPRAVETVADAVLAEAERLSGEAIGMRPLLKRARLPRLGKALG